MAGGHSPEARTTRSASGTWRPAELRRLDGHGSLVSCVAFSADGRQALSGGFDQNVILWNLESGQALKTLSGRSKYVNALAFAPDGQSGAGG